MWKRVKEQLPGSIHTLVNKKVNGLLWKRVRQYKVLALCYWQSPACSSVQLKEENRDSRTKDAKTLIFLHFSKKMTQILKVNLAHNMLRIYWQGHTKTMTHQETRGQLRRRTDVYEPTFIIDINQV